jgi:pimeloyl-ACP methyl ester carboxylesterase
MRNARQSAVALDVSELMEALKIRTAIVGGFDWDAYTAEVLADAMGGTPRGDRFRQRLSH